MVKTAFVFVKFHFGMEKVKLEGIYTKNGISSGTGEAHKNLDTA